MMYIDVNIFVYWLTGHKRYGNIAYKILEKVEKGSKAITSALTLWLLHVLLSEICKNYNALEMFKRIKALRGLRIVPLTPEIFEKAITIMNKYDLDLEDAIHLATAIKYKAEKIASNDGDFDRTPLQRVFENIDD